MTLYICSIAINRISNCARLTSWHCSQYATFSIFVLDASVFLSIFWIKVLCFLLFCCHVIMHAKLFIPLIRVFAILYKNNTTIHWIKTLETVSRLRIFLQQFWSISDVTWALIGKYYECIKIIFSDKEYIFGYLNLYI